MVTNLRIQLDAANAKIAKLQADLEKTLSSSNQVCLALEQCEEAYSNERRRADYYQGAYEKVKEELDGVKSVYNSRLAEWEKDRLALLSKLSRSTECKDIMEWVVDSSYPDGECWELRRGTKLLGCVLSTASPDMTDTIYEGMWYEDGTYQYIPTNIVKGESMKEVAQKIIDCHLAREIDSK